MSEATSERTQAGKGCETLGAMPGFSGAMRPALGAPVLMQAPPSLTLRGVVRRIGTTLLMLASYGAIVASLTVLFSGIYLTAVDYLEPKPGATAPPQAWQATLAERAPIEADFQAYRRPVSGGFGGYASFK